MKSSMKRTLLCVWLVATVAAFAQTPSEPRARPQAVAPPLLQPSDPFRLPGQEGRRIKEQKPAMSLPKEPVAKRPSLVPVKPPALGLCDGS